MVLNAEEKTKPKNVTENLPMDNCQARDLPRVQSSLSRWIFIFVFLLLLWFCCCFVFCISVTFDIHICFEITSMLLLLLLFLLKLQQCHKRKCEQKVRVGAAMPIRSLRVGGARVEGVGVGRQTLRCVQHGYYIAYSFSWRRNSFSFNFVDTSFDEVSS